MGENDRDCRVYYVQCPEQNCHHFILENAESLDKGKRSSTVLAGVNAAIAIILVVIGVIQICLMARGH